MESFSIMSVPDFCVFMQHLLQADGPLYKLKHIFTGAPHGPRVPSCKLYGKKTMKQSWVVHLPIWQMRRCHYTILVWTMLSPRLLESSLNQDTDLMVSHITRSFIYHVCTTWIFTQHCLNSQSPRVVSLWIFVPQHNILKYSFGTQSLHGSLCACSHKLRQRSSTFLANKRFFFIKKMGIFFHKWKCVKSGPHHWNFPVFTFLLQYFNGHFKYPVFDILIKIMLEIFLCVYQQTHFQEVQLSVYVKCWWQI